MAEVWVDFTLGDDSDPGTELLPWKNASKVNGTAQSAGDIINWRRGEVWAEDLTLFNTTGGGAVSPAGPAAGLGPGASVPDRLDRGRTLRTVILLRPLVLITPVFCPI